MSAIFCAVGQKVTWTKKSTYIFVDICNHDKVGLFNGSQVLFILSSIANMPLLPMHVDLGDLSNGLTDSIRRDEYETQREKQQASYIARVRDAQREDREEQEDLNACIAELRQQQALPVRLCSNLCVLLAISIAVATTTIVLAIPALADEHENVRLFSFSAIVFNTIAIVMTVGMHLTMTNMDVYEKRTNIVHVVCVGMVKFLAAFEVMIGIWVVVMAIMSVGKCSQVLWVFAFISPWPLIGWAFIVQEGLANHNKPYD